MLATLAGLLALLLGLLVLLLPLLACELSRPRDAAWGAVVLLLGLVLVTSTERLTGAPMLAVLCGGLLIGRLGTEVGQARWRQLSEEERQRLGSAERWRSSLAQLGAAFLAMLAMAGTAVRGLGEWIRERRGAKTVTKRWVRPEAPSEAPIEAQAETPAEPSSEAPPEEGVSPEEGQAATSGDAGEAETGAAPGAADETVVVSDFGEIEALLEQAPRRDPHAPDPDGAG
ncbi:MAG: Ycf66 family protein [Synechococcaceae cyanobacterium]|nr:Ycf66 family protein [Synechococcaceae cyanobacterium]